MSYTVRVKRLPGRMQRFGRDMGQAITSAALCWHHHHPAGGTWFNDHSRRLGRDGDGFDPLDQPTALDTAGGIAIPHHAGLAGHTLGIDQAPGALPRGISRGIHGGVALDL